MSSNSLAIASLDVNKKMPANPCGFYVLVELIEVEDVTEGGIILTGTDREQTAEEIGYLRAVGPTAYLGWAGCEAVQGSRVPAYKKWGLEIDDLVEFRRFEGKAMAVPEFKNWRYIPDSHIVGVINYD